MLQINNAIIESYDLTKYDEPKKEDNKETKVKNVSKPLVVPVSWDKNEMSLVDVDTWSLKTIRKKPEYLSTMKTPNYWELYLQLSAREIPKTTVIKVKADTIPLLKNLAIIHPSWSRLT